MAYPDIFGGCWSTAPDPVDFRDFQKINVYEKGDNMFMDAEGKPRPDRAHERQGRRSSTSRSRTWRTSWAAAASSARSRPSSARAAPDGKPRPLWDRKTGAIDPEVATAWEKYDIRLVLERNWKTLGPKLAGKIHVYMGEEDTFYLEGATALLKESLAELGSDAVVELFPGRTTARWSMPRCASG